MKRNTIFLKRILTVTYIILSATLILASPAYSDFKKTVDVKDSWPERPRREESFLGIHFDFHAGSGDKEIGKRVTEEMVQTIIDKVNPDYVQIDCKGHPGYSSYTTDVGNRAGGFVKNPLPIWRKVTARNGVGLYMHYSGVWDTKAIKEHPEWAVVNADGKRNKDKTSVFGPYVDKLLIPQLKELRRDYKVDGMWIDGEVWAVEVDYSKWAVNEWKKSHDYDPPKKGDPNYHEYVEFCRQGFRDYVDHYVTELHKFDPDFQIASNWAYTGLMPEKPTINLDFISGDYSPRESINTARHEARVIRHQDMPWDLMAWGFGCNLQDRPFTRASKPVIQMKQEAAMVLAQGGGFQAYYPQERDGSVALYKMDIMAEVAKFCREKQEFCHEAETVPQVALFLSSYASYKMLDKPFNPGGFYLPMRGIMHSLLDSQYSVDIFMEHSLKYKISEYPVVVFPQWLYLKPGYKKVFTDYVKNGGNLVLIGPKSAELFKDEIGISKLDNPVKAAKYYESDGIWAGAAGFAAKDWEFAQKAKVIEKMHTINNPDSPSDVAATLTEYGDGKIVAAYQDIGEHQYKRYNTILRDYIASLVKQVFPEPKAEITGSRNVEVQINRINGDLAVNLINTTNPGNDLRTYTYDQVPPVGPLNIKIRVDEKPESVTLQPAGKKLNFIYSDGIIRTKIDELKIHQVIIVK